MHCEGTTVSYGCLFCRTGKEERLARALETHYPDLEALSPVKMRYRRQGGKLCEEQVTLFPGYIFFRAACDFDAFALSAHGDVYSLLTSSEMDWRLNENDESMVKLMFDAGGEIALSKAYFEGERIRIQEGFLKRYEGQIIRVNRRARTVQIGVQLHDKIITIWLGYEEIEHAGK